MHKTKSEETDLLSTSLNVSSYNVLGTLRRSSLKSVLPEFYVYPKEAALPPTFQDTLAAFPFPTLGDIFLQVMDTDSQGPN